MDYLRPAQTQPAGAVFNWDDADMDVGNRGSYPAAVEGGGDVPSVGSRQFGELGSGTFGIGLPVSDQVLAMAEEARGGRILAQMRDDGIDAQAAQEQAILARQAALARSNAAARNNDPNYGHEGRGSVASDTSALTRFMSNPSGGGIPTTQQEALELFRNMPSRSLLDQAGAGSYRSPGEARASTAMEVFENSYGGRVLTGGYNAWTALPKMIKETTLGAYDFIGASTYAVGNTLMGSDVPYEPVGAIGMSIRDRGVLPTLGDGMRGMVMGAPGVGLVSGLYHRNPEEIGSGAFATALGGYGLYKNYVGSGEIIYRADNYMYSATGAESWKLKSYVDDVGLHPANEMGAATPFQHVRGLPDVKNNSAFTSFSDSLATEKAYGDRYFGLDAGRLKNDISAGRLPGVEYFDHDTLMGMHDSAVQSAQVKYDLRPSQKNLENLELSKTLRGYSARDQEWLIKGSVPFDYLRWR